MNMFTANRCLVTALALLVSAGSLDVARAHGDQGDDTTYSASWASKASLPEKRSDMTASTVGSKIYVIGGCNQHQVACDWWDGCSYCPSISNEVLVYTPESDSYTTSTTAMLRERYRHAAVVVDTDVYLFGGRDANDGLISEVDVLNTTDMSWTTLTSAAWNIPRSDEAAFYYSATGKIYVGGGYNYSYSAYATIDIFDPSSNTWTYSRSDSTIASMNEPRGDFAFVEVNSKFYAYGGWSHNDWCNPLNSTEVYNPSSDTWTVLADLQAGRGDKACGALNDRIFAIGGEHNEQCNGSSTPVDDVEVYDPAHPNRGWVIESTIPEEKFRFASATYDGSIYVFGGQSSYSTTCSGYDYCFPVTNHTWAFTESSSSSKSNSRKIPLVVILLCVFFFAVLAFFACLGFFSKTEAGRSLLGKTPSSSAEVPAEEPKDGVEMNTTALTVTEGEADDVQV